MLGVALFSGLETGIISIHRLRLKHRVRKGSTSARIIERFLENPDRLLGTTLVGTNIGVVLISTATASLTIHLFGEWAQPFSALVIALALLVFCEYLPKAWFHSRPIERSQSFAGILNVAEIILRPVSWVVMFASRLISSNAKPGNIPRHDIFLTRENLQHILRDSEERGELSAMERTMISRVINLPRLKAHNIMIPIDKATVVDTTMPLSQFFDIARETNFTRFPVRNGDDHSFSGIINIFFPLNYRGNCDEATVGDFIRRPLRIPDSMPVREILPRLRRSRLPMALVINANETVTGIVTTEDVLEEIIG